MTVTANIKLRKPNFAVKDGYFYTIDDDQDALLQKTDDGNTAFSYPLDTLLTNVIISLEYDGVCFWSLEYTGSIYKIKRWKIDNYICKLQGTFDMSFGSGHTISTNCFTLEHYHTTPSAGITVGDSTIYITDYANNPEVITSAILHIGPNQNGDEEDLTVTGVVYGGVTLSSPVQFSYTTDDEINFHRRIWLFNNYNGNDSTTGALYKLDSHSGGYMDKFSGGAYKDIKACTFYKIDAFASLGHQDMLLYTKGTNMLFVNTSEYRKDLYDANTADETFTGADGSAPNTSRWFTNIGTPTIQSNKLQLNLTASGVENITSKYYVNEDFDVYIDGSFGTYDSGYSGSGYYQHSLSILFANESNRYCSVSRGYSTEFGDFLNQNFSSTSRSSTDTVVSGVLALDGVDHINEYGLRLRRVGADIHFFYRTVVSGTTSSWLSLGSKTMYASDAQIVLSATSSLSSTFVTNSDNLTYTEGQVAYLSAATALPYYGSMVMDNIGADEYTVDPLYDMSIDRDNIYRLHSLSGVYSYALSPLESFVTSISLSASPAIIAANGLSTTAIKAWVKDQFLQPITGRRVTFSENGDGSITAGTQINTDSTGFAQTVYQAGTSAQSVIVTAVVQQTN